MSHPILYNIPARLVDHYRGRTLIIRSAVPAQIIDALQRVNQADVRFVQLLSLTEYWGFLLCAWKQMPIELVLKNPVADCGRLYSFSNLLESHPVRVAIPVVAGFSDAVKLAVSLDFGVRLQLDQPGPSLIEELMRVLDLYLHRTTLRQPIEFFQTTLLSFYRHEPISLWSVAEEDPNQVRYVTDKGEETISKRFAGTPLDYQLDEFVERFGEQLLFQGNECHECEFFNRCGGYFKWPD